MCLRVQTPSGCLGEEACTIPDPLGLFKLPVGLGGKVTVRILPAVYLCVQQSLAEAVGREGFTCRARTHAAVSPTMQAAVEAYARRHTEPPAVFRVLLSKFPDLNLKVWSLFHSTILFHLHGVSN